MYFRSFTVVAVVLLAGIADAQMLPDAPEGAGAASPASAPAMSTEQKQIARRMMHEFQGHDYARAADDCRLLIAENPRNGVLKYQLACTLCRLGKKDEALATLAQSIQQGYVEAFHIAHDDDLLPLHDDPRFAEDVAKAHAAQKAAKYEEGEELKDVKTVEDYPENGLRYRLRMSPDATARKPDRLVVWLHPSGASADNVVEKLAPEFAKRGFALVVFTRKQYAGWMPEEIEQLRNTLAALGKVSGIDAARPILMGFSAGGQLALMMYLDHPGDFGGLIVNSAYPFDSDAAAQGKIVPAELPNDPAIKDVPVLAICGTKDGGSAFWKKVEPAWHDAGVPLSVIYVEGQGHTYLIRGKQLPIVEDWLDQIAAGKKPAGLTAPATTAPAAPEADPAAPPESPLDAAKMAR